MTLVFQLLAFIIGKFAAIYIQKYSFIAIILNPYYIASLLCLAGQALCWQLILRRLPLFRSYLFMSGIYILILIGSHYIFHENITKCNIIGSFIIIFGITILTRESFKNNDY